MTVDEILSEDPFKNVVTLYNTRNGATIYLLGTCHVSEESARSAELLVEKVCPDTLFLELSHERGYVLLGDRNIKKIIPLPKNQDILTKLTYCFHITISTMYLELEYILQRSAGNEFRSAFEVARSQGTRVCLGDRDSRVTLQRLAAHYLQPLNLSSFNLLFDRMIDLLITKQTDENSERISKACQEILRDIVFHPPKFQGWWNFLDALRDDQRIKIFLEKVIDYCLEYDLDASSTPPPLLSERDEYMASNLRDCDGDIIVGIVGKAHIPGISKHLNDHHIVGSTLRAEMYQPAKISSYTLLAQWLCIFSTTAYVSHKCIYHIFRPRYTHFPKSIYFRIFFPVISVGFLYDVAKFMQTRIPCPHSEPLWSPFTQFVLYPSAFSDLQSSLSTKLIGVSMGAYITYNYYKFSDQIFQPRYKHFPKSIYFRFFFPVIPIGFLYGAAKFMPTCTSSPLRQFIFDPSVNKFNDLQSLDKITGVSMAITLSLGAYRGTTWVWRRGALHYGWRRGGLHYGNQLLRFIKFR